MTALAARDVPAALFGSATARYRALTAWDAALRAAVPTTHRIGVVSLAPGAGTTTLTEQVLRVVAARRRDPVLVVDSSPDGGGVAARLGAAVTPPDDGRLRARSSADAVRGLTRGDGWVALRPHPTDSVVAAWLGEAAPIARFFDVTLTDFGACPPRGELAAIAALCDVVCLVSDGTRASAEVARGVAPAIEALPERPRTVLALVDHAGHGSAVARALSGDPRPVIRIPRDSGLASRGRPRSTAARAALLRLAAALLGGTREAAA